MLELQEARSEAQAVYIFMQGVNLIDATGLEVLARLFQQYQQRGLEIHLVAAKLEVERAIKQAFGHNTGIRFHRTEKEAIESMPLTVDNSTAH